MPMERLAVLAAIQTARHSHGNENGNSTSETHGGGYGLQPYNTSNGGSGRSGKFEPDLNGNVNIFLGGAMMSGVIIVVVLICYCCHRNIRKHRPQEYQLYWRPEPDVHSLEVFTTHGMCYGGQQQHLQQPIAAAVNYEEETIPPRCPSSLGPPPTYDSLIFNPHSIASPSEKSNPEAPAADEIIDVPKEAKSELPTEATKSEMPAALRENGNEGLPSYEVALKLEANGYV